LKLRLKPSQYRFLSLPSTLSSENKLPKLFSSLGLLSNRRRLYGLIRVNPSLSDDHGRVQEGVREVIAIITKLVVRKCDVLQNTIDRNIIPKYKKGVLGKSIKANAWRGGYLSGQTANSLSKRFSMVSRKMGIFELRPNFDRINDDA
jgi:hypothetical protein